MVRVATLADAALANPAAATRAVAAITPIFILGFTTYSLKNRDLASRIRVELAFFSLW